LITAEEVSNAICSTIAEGSRFSVISNSVVAFETIKRLVRGCLLQSVKVEVEWIGREAEV
jgi:hypothetical protein